MKYFFFVLCFFLFSSYAWCQSFEKGKDFFLKNNPVEAALYFEKAMYEEPENEDVFMYLGLSYIQNDLIDKAIDIFIEGADLKGRQRGRFYLNAGNAYFSRGQFDEALNLYNLIIDENLAQKGEALLNRANILMNKNELLQAVSVYKDYLVEEPQSIQKAKIIRLISLIEKKIDDEALEAARLAAEAERRRLADEQTQADAEAEAERLRSAEEKRKAEEAARQQALMDEILNSLSNIADETQNIAADSETIIHTDEESDIDD